MNKFKACIFDMDGVDNKDFHIEAWRIYAGIHGYHVGPEKVKHWFNGTNETLLINDFSEISLSDLKKLFSKKANE